MAVFCGTVTLIQSLYPLLVSAAGAGATAVLGKGKGVSAEGFL